MLTRAWFTPYMASSGAFCNRCLNFFGEEAP
nr:MAG TPA: hypothetical protein [Caudoviricetes sp.]